MKEAFPFLFLLFNCLSQHMWSLWTVLKSLYLSDISNNQYITYVHIPHAKIFMYMSLKHHTPSYLTVLSATVPASLSCPAVHGCSTLGAVPLSFRGCSDAHTGIVEPLHRTLRVVTSHHIPIRHLVADAVPWLIGVISPVRVLSIGVKYGAVQGII